MNDTIKPRAAKSPVKSKTFWGLGLLVATLVTSKTGIPLAPEDVDLAVQAITGAVGTILGVWGRVTAKERIKAPSLPLPVLALLMPILTLHVIFLVGLSGCASSGGGEAPTIAREIDLALVGITAGVLRNNPRYEPMVGDIIARIDVLVARGHTSPALLAEFLAQLQAKHGLQGADLEEITAAITAVRLVYSRVTGQPFPLELQLDARAVAYMRAVQAALAEGTTWAQLFPKA